MSHHVQIPIARLGSRPIAVELTPAGSRRRQALVLQTDDGTVLAFLNLCRHLPVPLDALRGGFLDDSGTHFLCRTHGAKYRITDGVCIEGPCQGASLIRLTVAKSGGGYCIVDDVSDAEND